MTKIKVLVMEICAQEQTGNPYKDIEKIDWCARKLYYTYFTTDGKQLGRRRCIELKNGKELPQDLVFNILDRTVIKMAWDANKTRIYTSRLLGIKDHIYLKPDSWIDIRILAKINGISADSRSKVATALKIYHKHPTQAGSFSLIIKICKVLTKRDNLNLNQLSYYAKNQKINDKGIMINFDCINAGKRLIELYNSAIQHFACVTGFVPKSMNIKEYFRQKYRLKDTEKIYNLLEFDSGLSEYDKTIIYILRYENSSTIKNFMKISKMVCCDHRLRGMIHYWSNVSTGGYGGLSIYEKFYFYTKWKPEEYIDKISKIEEVEISSVELIIDSIKNLIPLLYIFEKSKVILDLSRVAEYTVAKLSDCNWRKEAFVNDNLAKSLQKSWTKVSLSSSQILKYDLQLCMGNQVRDLDNSAVLQWRSLNDDILKCYGLLSSIFKKTLTNKTVYKYHDIIFSYCKPVLSIQLPTKRTINISVKTNVSKIGFYWIDANTGQLITGRYIFKVVCRAIQRDVLTKLLYTLMANGYNVLYHTSTDIFLDDDKELLPEVISSPFVKHYFFP